MHFSIFWEKLHAKPLSMLLSSEGRPVFTKTKNIVSSLKREKKVFSLVDKEGKKREERGLSLFTTKPLLTASHQKHAFIITATYTKFPIKNYPTPFHFPIKFMRLGKKYSKIFFFLKCVELWLRCLFLELEFLWFFRFFISLFFCKKLLHKKSMSWQVLGTIITFLPFFCPFFLF